ncbi:WYL domain-containing protein [Bacillus chungangensis]|uniref:DNA-binding transcriptional regulator YafY n=1 Tax=Bacillus chungangensis TaxID=587633 RepID=A0ABT9WQD9_9BACI|nr:WYL domain-containing protein [Bacillus chungangensis]MDQ0175494.1 putative DNA-binding transcriptional regulator YafY [Bacillus chungangensis]
MSKTQRLIELMMTVNAKNSDGLTKRVIQPIGLYSCSGFWYCPAYCFKRKTFRLFRADRIHHAERTIDEQKKRHTLSICY